MKIGERVHSIIDDKDIKQKALAERIGVRYGAFNSYMVGRAQFPCEVVAKLAEELDTTADYLLGVSKSPLKPFPVSLSERQFLQGMRSLSPQQRELLVQTLKLMLEQNKG